MVNRSLLAGSSHARVKSCASVSPSSAGSSLLPMFAAAPAHAATPAAGQRISVATDDHFYFVDPTTMALDLSGYGFPLAGIDVNDEGYGFALINGDYGDDPCSMVKP